jgi:hypothetical protein
VSYSTEAATSKAANSEVNAIATANDSDIAAAKLTKPSR